MQFSSTLMKRISVPIPEIKKKWIDKRFKNFFAHSKEIRAKWDVVKLVRFLPNTVGGGSLGDSTTTANKIFI